LCRVLNQKAALDLHARQVAVPNSGGPAMRLSTQLYLVTNTPAFANPAASVAGSNFGYSTSLIGSTGGRTINLSGRINF
jgi:hypothetical protein